MTVLWSFHYKEKETVYIFLNALRTLKFLINYRTESVGDLSENNQDSFTRASKLSWNNLCFGFNSVCLRSSCPSTSCSISKEDTTSKKTITRFSKGSKTTGISWTTMINFSIWNYSKEIRMILQTFLVKNKTWFSTT